MKRLAKWLGLVLGGLLILIAIGFGLVYAISSRAMSKTYAIIPAPLTIPGDSASIARGRHLVTAVNQCGNCHGDNLAGKVFVDNPVMGRIYAANLTRGSGGIGGEYSDADYVRSIRHGIGRNGRPLLAMPVDAFYYMSDADLASIVAYLKTIPAEELPHDQPRPADVPRGITREYGGYLATIGGCKSCHLPDLNGGVPVEGNVLTANLTPTGIGTWTEADFTKAMRTGIRPDGRILSAAMPWPYLRHMTDDELRALWLYLRSLPPKDARGR